MAKNKFQHFVPRSYQAAWEFAQKSLWLYDLEKQKVHSGNPATLCGEDHLYTFKEFKEEDRLMLDNYMGDIETGGAPVIQKIINREAISDDEREKLSLFIAAQKLRTPTQEKLDEQLSVKMLEKDLQKKIVIRNHKSMWLKQMVEFLIPATEKYLNADWYILRADRGESFITSDNPVVTISMVRDVPAPTQEDITKTEVTFPLSPHVLILMRYSKRGNIIESEKCENNDSIRELNMRTTMYAQRYIFSQSQELLLATVKRNYRQWEHIRKHDPISPILEGKMSVVEMPKSEYPRFAIRER